VLSNFEVAQQLLIEHRDIIMRDLDQISKMRSPQVRLSR
jgi:hypothetical protein